MKRIHLFEFEDLPWFPNWIRELMTRYIQTFHKILNTADHLVPLGDGNSHCISYHAFGYPFGQTYYLETVGIHLPYTHTADIYCMGWCCIKCQNLYFGGYAGANWK